MTNPHHIPALDRIHGIADQEAKRLCRSLGLPVQELDDVRQDLLVDFMARFPAFDPARAELAAFARVCMRHAATRIAGRVKRERAGRYPRSLDDTLPDTEGLTLGDTIAQDEGYGAWCGQPTDAIATLERRLDLERAAVVINPNDHALCAALTTHTAHELGEQQMMPRARIYRRIRELRLCLLAAGIPSAA